MSWPASDFRGGPRRPLNPSIADGTVSPSKSLAAFVSAVCAQTSAELVDLGPVVGSNITFLSERIGCGCKIHVEDLYADLDRHARESALDTVATFLATRFPMPDGTVDAVLGWDIFDYLDPEAARVLAGELARILRPGGAILAFFGPTAPGELRHAKYVIEDEGHLRVRFYPAACRRRRVLQNREIRDLFPEFTVVDSILLKSGVREVLFQKPR